MSGVRGHRRNRGRNRQQNHHHRGPEEGRQTADRHRHQPEELGSPRRGHHQAGQDGLEHHQELQADQGCHNVRVQPVRRGVHLDSARPDRGPVRERQDEGQLSAGRQLQGVLQAAQRADQEPRDHSGRQPVDAGPVLVHEDGVVQEGLHRKRLELSDWGYRGEAEVVDKQVL